MDKVRKDTAKQQHYVPQFLLRHFAVVGSEQLFKYNKREQRQIPSSVRKSACENGFYNIHTSNGKITLEHRLCTLEEKTSSVIKEIQKTMSFSDIEIDDDKHITLCYFVAFMIHRTRKYRNFIKQTEDHIHGFLKNHGYKVPDIDNDKKARENELTYKQNIFLMEKSKKIAHIIGGKPMGLLQAPEKSSFLISDSPITMRCHYPNKMNTKGISVYGVEILFPISKNLCLSFLCLDFYKTLTDHYRGIENSYLSTQGEGFYSYMDNLLDSITLKESRVISSNDVASINSLQVVDSLEWVFNDTDDFAFVESVLVK